MKMGLPFSLSGLKPLLVLLTILSILGCTRALVKCLERERLALLDFKKSFVSDPYDVLSSWKSTEENCCTWDGITCHNLTGHVISLDFRFKFLKSYQLRPSLVELQHMRSLFLSMNDFAMRIPEFFGSFRELTYLDLSYAKFFGKIPPHLGNLTSIQTLDFNSNQLSVDNFQWLSSLSSLEDLDMGHTNSTGAKDWLSTIGRLPLLQSFQCESCSLPPPVLSSTVASNQVNSSTSLEMLDLSGNILFSSTIYWLVNSTNLSFLDLSYVNLRGSPEWLSHLSSLDTLDLSFANFSDSGDWLSTVRKLPLLSSFSCVSCSLAPPIFSFSICDHLNFSASLQTLDLSSSYLSSSTISCLMNNTTNLLEVVLEDMNLEGPFLDLFHDMISLEKLDLSGNNLEGVIFESIGNLCNLQDLDVSKTGWKQSFADVLGALTGCASSSLQTLDLSWNNLTGILPPILKFTSLTSLDLSHNCLHSFSLQNSTSLFKPQVSDTLHYFPASFSSLDLSSNSLNGVLSDVHFTNLSQLTDLCLSNNPNLIVNFSKPPANVEALYLSSCKLGPSFPTWLLSQTSFTDLDISNSNISGSIPVIFWKNLPSSLVYLNLSFNSFHDMVPNLPFSFNFYSLTIDLTSNSFYGPIPSLLLKANVLFLSKNNFSCFAPLPRLPSELSTFGYQINNFAGLSNVLDISNNRLLGVLPDWFWFHLIVLDSLNLANNNLSGTIPSSIPFPPQLFVLSLRNNAFSGPLPLWLKNCSEMRILDLSENRFSGFIPFWMGEHMEKLILLSLQSNKLMGTLPSTLCHLDSLQILDLSHNMLSRNIPSCVGNFTAMVSDVNSSFEILVLSMDPISQLSLATKALFFFYAFIKWKGVDQLFQKNLPLVKLIDLSNNNLSGEIPVGLTSLLGLESLDLSSNIFNGSIPAQIGQLKSLEVLNLSYNKLRGQIPSSLSAISSLAILNLSHNNLSGRIPTGTQLQGFNSSAYAGNPELCGLPLPIKCPGDGQDSIPVPQPPSMDDNDKEDKWPDEQCFYAGMGTGFGFGFLMILAMLTMIRKWRYAFFRFASHFADWILALVAISNSKISRKLHFK